MAIRRSANEPHFWPEPRKAEMRRALLAWYRHRARDLPWRRTRDPYRIWLSEILLQQTRVETAIPYYERFLEALPTVETLAAAPQEQVLTLWSGVGYYSRARNLHRAAQTIVEEHGGEIPRTAEQLQKLPGVGRYTAAAVASIAFGHPAAALDGNIKRVLARLLAIREPIDAPATQSRLWDAAEELLSRRSPGAFNQAMMELGATVCTPKSAKCLTCPLREHCQAFKCGLVDTIPTRRRRAASPHVDAVQAAITHNDRVLMVRRPSSGLLAGMWELPGGPLENGEPHDAALKQHLRSKLGIAIRVGEACGEVSHVFSHRTLLIHIYRGKLASRVNLARATCEHKWVARDEIDAIPLASVDRKVLRQIGHVTTRDR